MKRVAIGFLAAAAMCGCAARPNVNTATVYAPHEQTLKQMIDALPPSGGVIQLGLGAWLTGYQPGTFISKPNVTIQGSGMPGYNADFTAMIGGTILLGPLGASTGADGFTVRDLGIDAGQAYVTEHNGGSATDAFAIFNNAQVIGAPPVQSPVIENVSCLGSSPTAKFHCMLVENVNNAYIHNVMTVMNRHGLVLKGTNSTINGVYSRGHSIDSVIVKSDAFAPTSHDALSQINIAPLVAPDDTKGIVVTGIGAPVSDINISNVNVRSPVAWGLYVKGATETNSASNLTFSDFSVDYSGGSPSSHYCMQFALYVRNVTINNLSCSNMWAGISPLLPDSAIFGGFSVINSQFSGIGTDGITTYGLWKISTSRFTNIKGNGIVNPFGVTTVSGNTFVNIKGSNMLSTGGTFVQQ